MWIEFFDMASGGQEKLDWGTIYMEASASKYLDPYDQARDLFMEVFKRNPENVTCECCGPDYTIDYEDTLTEITGLKDAELQRHLNNERVLTLNQGEIQMLRQGRRIKGVKT